MDSIGLHNSQDEWKFIAQAIITIKIYTFTKTLFQYNINNDLITSHGRDWEALHYQSGATERPAWKPASKQTDTNLDPWFVAAIYCHLSGRTPKITAPRVEDQTNSVVFYAVI